MSIMNSSIAIILVIYVALIVILITSLWKLYVKASQPGWACLVPIYNGYILLKIIGKPGWWLLLYFIPFVNIIFLIWTYNLLSKSFGKDSGFTVGLILLSPVFLPILGLGSAQYQGPYGNPEEFAKWQQRNQFDFEK